MRRWFLRYAGLERPRRFERTLAVLVALALALLVGAIALRLSLKDELTWATPRGWYFLYLAGLIAVGFIVAPWPRLAILVLALATLEVGFGFGTAMLYKYRLTTSETLFPRNYTRPPYGWHPLLQVLPLPTPPSQAAQARVFINSERTRGRERTPAELAGKTVIALFGGSTTLDFVSPEGQTWGDRLERRLGPDRYAVINHGVSGYTTAEHVIQTAFYQSSFGTAPTCAIYYVGWNDLRNAHITDLDPAYANYHLRAQIDALEARRMGGPGLSISPTLSFLGKLAVLAFDTVRPAERPQGAFGGGPDPVFEAIYVRNIHSISAINRQRGVRTIWVGQVMNNKILTRDTTDGWLPFVREREVPSMIGWMNSILKREAGALRDAHADLSADAFGPDDFGDEGHFRPSGSAKFAARLAPIVEEACR